ncbi:peptidylprolyl isomerase [soil metagenome]
MPSLLRNAFALAVFLLPAVGVLAQPVQPGQTLDRIVAVVGGDIILASEVDALAEEVAASQNQQVTDALWSRALEQIVNQHTLAVAAEADTLIVVSEAIVEGELSRRLDLIMQQVGSEERLIAETGRTVAQLRTEWRGEIRRQLLAQQFQTRRMQNVRVTPQEVRAFFEAIPVADRPMVPEVVRIAHIVRMPEVDASAREDAIEKAEAIRDSIVTQQATIEQMATRYSQDPGSATRGGRYQGLNVRELVPEFGAVAGTLAPGQVSQVFETSFGFHVMRLNERAGDQLDFNHVLVTVDRSRADASGAIAMLSTLRDSIMTHNVPFESLARRHSQEEQTAALGGYVVDPRTGERDLRLEGLTPGWRSTVSSVSVGEVSEPREVQLLDGQRAYHILKLQRRTPAHRLSYEDDYVLLEQYALADKRQRVIENLLDGLRERTYLDIRTDRYSGPLASR